MVSRTSAKLVPFVRDHLFTSVHDSCRHRTTSIDDASALTQTIITELMKKQDGGIVARDDIARTARDILQRFDTAAATFYAAYHPVPAKA
jgi:transcriptional regulator NrdR family protein